jgi:hypothetical protein
MTLFFRNIDSVIQNILWRGLQRSLYGKSGEITHMVTTGSTQLVDYKTGTF